MTDYEQKDNTATLFRNDKKTSDKSPDFRGDAVIDGVKKRVALWIKEGRKGEFYSLAFSDPQEREERAPEASRSKPYTR